LPLRGHLSCPKCNKNLTGSGSTSRNGKRHYYYHCQHSKGCDFRVKTSELHAALNGLFKELKVSDEVVSLFKLILQDRFEKTEKSNKQQLKKSTTELKKIERKKETLLEKMIEGIINDNDFQKHNDKYDEQITELEVEIDNLKGDDKELKEFISFGTFMLQNLSEVYSKLDVNGKGKLIGSIFDEKLVYLKNKYRTPRLKDGAAFIFNNNKALQSLKTKKGDSFKKVSSLVPEAGIEPALPKELDFESSASTSSATRAR
jgi:site-specific DNA recombinase